MNLAQKVHLRLGGFLILSHLLLTFRATGQAAEERTLWIDDVVVTEQPSLRDGRLINPATLTYQPLEHRLQPGEQLSLTVDADKRLRETYREVGGVSFHRVAGWANCLLIGRAATFCLRSWKRRSARCDCR